MLELAHNLIDTHGFMHQEIEFTFESPDPKDLYILQTRDQKVKKQKQYSTFVQSPEQMSLIGRGVGMGGGALSGILIFTMEDWERMVKDFPDEKLILVRPDTVPDDIPLIFKVDGLVTAKGGATSCLLYTSRCV